MTSNQIPMFESLAERHLAGVAALEALVSPSPWSRDLFAGELAVVAAQRHWLVAVDADQANGDGDGDSDSADDGGGGRRVVGFAGMMFADDVGHLMNIAVHPSWQRRGLGRRLAAAVFTEAVERGMQRLTLEVRASNSAALALYGHFGFAAAGTRPGYYRDGEDATILWAEHIAEPDFRTVIDRGAHPRD